MKKWMTRLCIPVFGLSMLVSAGAQSAQWPQSTVKLVVPFPPGSSNDSFARILSQALQEKTGQTFIVENRPGASGSIGIREVAQAKPDGHTVLVVSNSMVTNLTLPNQVNYDVFRDFEPVSMAATLPVVMVVNGGLPVANISEFIALAKKEPGTLKYGSSGTGSPHQLTAELFQSLTGTRLLHVPYKGQNPILMDLLAGRIDVAFLTLGPSLQYIEAKKLTSMGMLGEERTELAPDIPTLEENGVKGLDMGWWLGVFLPKGTNPEIVDALGQDIVRLSNDDAFKKKLKQVSIGAVGSTPAEFRSALKREIETWKKVAKAAGIKEQ
ncbi:Bug family tripartite tricarboxylate transporter substrate binding protein [Allopusillimonas ginsengisoli]|uniref:Bug family tripartite tricarboxylate transporter substrate binding protein n=1 Tax=Allopusillimonas ginsengisoli TaxID=453575 RepID=UPI00101F7967|nr:tripartite tricarboxylate transporter substrate binding protein [Allopusillimonas ginsengisoli]TEA79047.1 tripartite tricarboxylate transporter substrate binding protein [Allopusillimonas ginsengisoli]